MSIKNTVLPDVSELPCPLCDSPMIYAVAMCVRRQQCTNANCYLGDHFIDDELAELIHEQIQKIRSEK